MTCSKGTFALLMRMLCVVALMAAGWVSGPKLTAAAPVDLAAYTLPDGTLPVLCLTSDQDNGLPKATHDERCVACIINAGFLPVLVNTVGWTMSPVMYTLSSWHDETPPPPEPPSNTRPRAPPVF